MTHRILLLASTMAWAAVLPSDRAAAQGSPAATALIRIAGDTAMAGVVARWQNGFAKVRPDIRIEAAVLGTATGMPALYLGHADLALLGRESNTTDNDGFLHTLQYRPTRLQLLNGSLGAATKSAALAIFVSVGNPIRRLTLTQLDAICSAERRRGGPVIRTWGDLGARGEWQDAPIRVYLYDIETGTGAFFVRRVLRDCRKLNWERVSEVVAHDERGRDEAGAATVDALKRDKYGLAISTVAYADAAIAALAMSESEESPPCLPTAAAIVSGAYPLARPTSAFVNLPPSGRLQPALREFLHYVLGAEGQADIAEAGDFLPLSPAAAAKERAKLDSL